MLLAPEWTEKYPKKLERYGCSRKVGGFMSMNSPILLDSSVTSFFGLFIRKDDRRAS